MMADRQLSRAPAVGRSPIRLVKIMANRALCSRREAERLIAAGSVRVNGRVIDQQGVKVDSEARIEIVGIGERWMAARANGDMFRRKVGAAIVAVRRAGAIHAFDSINHFFLISQMVVPGSCYWNIAFGREKGAAEKDAEGMHTMQVLGQNMAWLMKRIAGA